MRARRPIALGLAWVGALWSTPALPYPLDGYPATGISRLIAYRLAAQGSTRPDFLTGGELLPSRAITLGLAHRKDFRVPAPDPVLSARLGELLGRDADAYGVTVLDWTDPERPRYAAHNEGRAQNPGSVGKLMVLLAWFQALADLHPDDLRARRQLLHDTEIVADGFIRNDEHLVPFWSFGQASTDRRPIAEGDRANLWTYLDWMASASSNAAAAMLMKHLVLLAHFGRDYPVPPERAEAFLAGTGPDELGAILLDAMLAPLGRNGLDAGSLRQGSFFTREGKRRIPGTNSTSTARSLLDFVVRMETGQLVDRFSSLEIKKLLYLTDARIRYAAQPALDDSALYFKSGSLYGCRPEPGYHCAKFHGNRINMMNSVVVVESPKHDPPLRYAVVILSNVLRRNSAHIHEKFAGEIHRILSELHD